MPVDVTPRRVQEAVWVGFDRQENARNLRLMMLRNFVGQYYDRDKGPIGTEPLNLIFNAIRVLVPNLVMNNPTHRVESRYLAYKDYAENLGLALDIGAKQDNLRDTFRKFVVDAIFLMGIIKTGLCDSGTAVAFDEYDHIDPGQLYSTIVDFDDLVVDPNTRGDIRDAAFIGDRIKVPRESLLQTGLYRNDFIERLPSCHNEHSDDRASDLSRGNITYDEGYLQDEVEIVELWVPQAKAIITVPGSKDIVFDEYLRADDYNGPDDGPYTFLKYTPYVSGNWLPVSMVGIWNDLHVMANRMAVKLMKQADRQKDVLGYRRNAADDAQEVIDAADGDSIALDDPEAVKVHSFGGQQQSNESHIQQLQMWFNMMAGNPQGVGGVSMDAKSATEVQVLQGNASVSLEDMKELTYLAVADVARKRAWYLHTDPLMNIPLIKRQQIPTPFGMQQEDVQVILTPEARSGDFLDFMFTIEPESMGRTDRASQLTAAMEFAVKVLPAALTSAQTCMMLGIPFNVSEFIVRMAKMAGITWLDQVFFDPMFQQRLAMQMMMGPQFGASKGQAVPRQGMMGMGMPGMGGGGLDQFMQNGQPGNVGRVDSPDVQMRQQQQSGAAASQANNMMRESY